MVWHVLPGVGSVLRCTQIPAQHVTAANKYGMYVLYVDGLDDLDHVWDLCHVDYLDHVDDVYMICIIYYT